MEESRPPTALSTDARKHRGRLLRALLAEEGFAMDGDEAEGQLWATSLEAGLDGLGDAVGRGRWLTGIRATRRQERERNKRDSDALSLTDSMLSTASTTPIASLRSAITQPIVPSGQPDPRHLLLCVSRSMVLPSEDSGFDIVSANVGCLFRAGVFEFPVDDNEAKQEILFGLEDWNENDDRFRKLVGGTFLFKGVTSSDQHSALSRVLRLTIYTHLSLLLEQDLLLDSGVALTFPPRPIITPAPSFTAPQTPSPPVSVSTPSTPKGAKDKAFLPGILSFFSKKGHPGLTRTRSNTPSSPAATRVGGSLDLSVPSRLSEDSGPSLIRPFSFLGPSPPQSISSAFTAGSTNTPFTTIHATLLASAPLLSSSAGITVPPPRLITELAEAERDTDADTRRRLRGDERVGLTSIRGWGDPVASSSKGPQESSKEAKAKAMVGSQGFARMQEIGVLVSWGIPVALTPSQASATSNVTTTTQPIAGPARLAQCLPPKTQTIRFYARDGAPGSEWSLGEVVQGWCREAAADPEQDGQGGCLHALFGDKRKRRRKTKDTVVVNREDAESTQGSLSGSEPETEEPEEEEGKKDKDQPRCVHKRSDHVLRMVHAGVRIEMKMRREGDEDGSESIRFARPSAAESESSRKEGSQSSATSTRSSVNSAKEEAAKQEKLETWLSCAVCGKKTARKDLKDGSFLFSFGKFVELLVYSPSICNITPSLCQHTDSLLSKTPEPSTSSDGSTPRPSSMTAASTPVSESSSVTPTQSRATITPKTRTSTENNPALPSSRFNIVRHFAAHGHVVTFSISEVADIFELRVPRLQITRRGLPAPALEKGKGKAKDDSSISSASHHNLKPPPIEEDKKILRKEIKAWWEGVADHMEKLETSLVGSTLVGFRKSLPRLPSEDDAWDDSGTESEATDTESETSSTHLRPSIPGLPPSAPTTPQISKAAHDYFPPPLNRSSSAPTVPDVLVTPTPSAPLVISAEDSLELLGTLRQTFQRMEQELYSLLSLTPVSQLNDVRRAFLGKAKGAERRLLAWQKKHLPGRGKRAVQLKMEGIREPEWWAKGCHVAPGCNLVVREDDWGSIIAFTMSTADYAKELTNISTARSTNGPMLSPAAVEPTSSPSSFFSVSSATNKLFSSTASNLPDPDQENNTVWYEPEAFSAVISRKEHPRDATSLLSLREVLRQKSPISIDGVSLLPSGSSRFSSLGSAATKASSKSGSSAAPPSAWSKPDVQITKHEAGGEVTGVPDSSEVGKILHELDFLVHSMFGDSHIKRGKAASIISVESDDTIGAKHKDDDEDKKTAEADLPTPTPSTFTNTLTSGISNAMRFVLNNGDIPRPSLFLKNQNHHGLLAPVDAFAIDERPHIKYDWTVGKRLKFSCTVYYAKQFDNLRKRCGVEDVFLKSLARSTNWAAEGGKSKSNFWKTADERFIIKTLVNAWNVADLQVLIELAPSYFAYMDATASRATVLAKLIGFYTIEIRNLETGNIQSKADLLVMENLFYGQQIVKTFDLKGIQGRRVKDKSRAGTSEGTTKTLFDGEWIEGQQRTLTLIHPHSKVVLHEAIRSDAEFLARSNIMDYSLLLGVDQERKQIACGLVDTIGSYTFAKTLEYKAKQGLNSGTGKEVTVIPPAEYQERFVSALEGYFLACPDKWSRATDDSRPIDDPRMLPSVL
ncbi:hypothetical protein HMN09_00505800 [Mycena chlorophos]|uniref:PIPK domain-containing protein n=1 Tax=Mycena chlorophos TaxID=658473 RepID=A0A8H6WCC6_MYCCL|nr:hypothetical protein HMN09_00505800 [Mycena chlorophos]